MSELSVFSYKLFSKYAKLLREYFQDVASDLKKAEIKYVLDEYISMVILFCLVTLVFSYVASLILLLVITKNVLVAIIIPVFVSIFLAIFVFTIFYMYPANVVAAKRKKVENALHFTTIYMATLAGTGVPPQELFRMIGQFEELGEVSRICKNIYRDMKVFGLDIHDAIERATEYSPSKDFKELLWGIKSNITSGGDLKMYLYQKSKGFVQDYRRKLEEFVKTLSVFMEMYITIVVVGSVFVLILTTIMSMLGGFIEQIKIIQMLLITVGLPFVSAAFIILMKTISPTEV